MATESINNANFGGEQRISPDDIDIILKSERLSRLKEIDFTDTYSESEIKNDLKLVERLKEEFHRQLEHFNESERARIEQGKKRSETLEVIFSEQGEANDWFGPDAMMVRTSEYDDIINGVDVVVEINQKENSDEIQRIALAVDASMRPNFTTVTKKISRNIDKLFGKQKMEVKYFQSQVPDFEGKRFRGKLTTIIPVVVGIEGTNADSLVEDVIKLASLEKSEQVNQKSPDINVKEYIKGEKRTLMKKLELHPAQIIFLEEISIQLKMYLNIISKNADKKTILSVTQIQTVLDIIKDIIGSKKEIKEDLNSRNEYQSLRDDGVSQIIKRVASKK